MHLCLLLITLVASGAQSDNVPTPAPTYYEEGIISTGVKTVWPTGPLGASYDVYCDGDEGGGWMLIWSYIHASGENTALDETTIPTSTTDSYSHINLEDLGYTESDIEEVRFYCTSDSITDVTQEITGNDGRILHFKTSETPVIIMAVTGDQTSSGNSVETWTSGYTTLTDGDSFLPDSTESVFATYSTNAFGYIPFYKFGTYHWSIGGGRWECDDSGLSTTANTKHLIYARMVDGRPTTVPTVSLSPSPLPTPSPTFVPTLLPTSLPSPVPTPSPTPDPSPVPTPLPSPVPTPSPTPDPSPVPTPLPSSSFPTQLPSFAPTPVPSPLPSPLPSLVPTIMPSSAPTIYCEAGTYFDGISCIECAIGRYATTTQAPFANNCTLCSAGQYNTATGQSECDLCATGKLSSSDRSHCKDCSAGEYSWNNEECVSCEYGKYAPTALKDNCLVCGAGFSTNNETAAISCISCTAGYYSNGSTDECDICPAGTSSPYSASKCTNCSMGLFAADNGSTTCSKCAAGTIAASERATSCDFCSPGMYQPATGESSCLECDPGKSESEYGSSSCSNCGAAYYSDSGSTGCDFSNVNYFKSTKDRSVSELCPKNANCAGGYQAPAPNKGYWVDRSDYEHVDNIYECSRLTCAGSNSNGSCWNIDVYNQSKVAEYDCDSDVLLCLEGALGPLCGSCEPGYIYRSELKQCGPCDDAKSSSFIAVGLAGIIGAIIGGMLSGLIPVYAMMKENTVVYFAKSLDTGSLKVLWVTFQIILSTSWNLDIKYPSPFNELLGLLSIFSLDFLALECFQDDVANRYFVTVYLWSCLPLIIATMIFVVMIIRLMRLDGSFNLLKSSDKSKPIVNQHMWMFLLLTYLVLPPVAMKQLQALDCIPFGHDSSSFLRADTAIDCQSSKYEKFKGVVIFFIILYQSIPILWMVLLYRQRAALDPVTSNHDENLALFIRGNNPDLASLRFLFHDYNSSKWWFEVAEMYRRVLFVGILPLVSPITATRASMGCVLAIASVAYYREERPYRVKFTNFISHLAQFVILITFYGALSIDTGVMMDFGLKDLGMGLFLVMTNLAIFGLCIWLGYIRYLSDRRKVKRRRAKADQIELADEFTAEKFQTTFEFITRTSVPISHVLAFHYTNMRLAKMARHSGIASMTKYDGVPFTLRQPHLTNKNDNLVFNTSNTSVSADGVSDGNDVKLDSGFPNDAVVVLALPKYILEELPGYETDGCLFRISTAMLNFMRPSSFTGVVDAKPWLNGVVLLSPTSIIRCYQLAIVQAYASDRSSRVNRASQDDSNILLRLSRMSSMLGDTSPSITVPPQKGSNTTKKQDELELQYASSQWVHKENYAQTTLGHGVEVVRIKSMLHYVEGMKKVRKDANTMNLKPLYHFTQTNVVPLILKGGLRMSTQGQGDGGVYFSTLGPASYRYGTKGYEENIIKACFGMHRMTEFMGLGKLDAVLIYGCSPQALQQAPGGRTHAKFVPRSLFEDLSIPHSDGTFFLQPEQLLTVFIMESASKLPTRSTWYEHELELERDMDKAVEQELEQFEEMVVSNVAHIEKAVLSLIPDVDLESRPHSDDDYDGGVSSHGVAMDGIEMSINPMSNHQSRQSSTTSPTMTPPLLPPPLPPQ